MKRLKRAGSLPLLGTPNVVTRELKLAIVEAAHRLGSDGKGKDGVVGYLTHLAEHDMKAYVPLLRTVLPLQIKSHIREVTTIRFPTEEEIEAEARRRGLPYMFMRLESVVENMRKYGMSVSRALWSAGLNHRLERIGRKIIQPDGIELREKPSWEEFIRNEESKDRSSTR